MVKPQDFKTQKEWEDSQESDTEILLGLINDELTKLLMQGLPLTKTGFTFHIEGKYNEKTKRETYDTMKTNGWHMLLWNSKEGSFVNVTKSL